MPYSENGIDFGKPTAIFASNQPCREKAMEICLAAKELIQK